MSISLSSVRRRKTKRKYWDVHIKLWLLLSKVKLCTHTTLSVYWSVRDAFIFHLLLNPTLLSPTSCHVNRFTILLLVSLFPNMIRSRSEQCVCVCVCVCYLCWLQVFIVSFRRKPHGLQGETELFSLWLKQLFTDILQDYIHVYQRLLS